MPRDTKKVNGQGKRTKAKGVDQRTPMSIVVEEIKDLGPVTFAQSKRCKRISISVRVFRGIRVARPMRISLKKAKGFLNKHIDWVRTNQQYIKNLEAEHKQTIRQQGEIFDDKNAKQYIIDRTSQLAQQHGFDYGKVTIRRQKTRWGSCSEKNNISLNISLAMLKIELCDYVILHELVHTKVKNHSKKFWILLDKYCCGNARQLDRELKKHLPGIVP